MNLQSVAIYTRLDRDDTGAARPSWRNCSPAA